MSLQEIEAEVMKLNLRARAELAKKILSSLDELTEEENERLWAEEAYRRFQEMESGQVKGRPAENVLRDARARLK